MRGAERPHIARQSARQGSGIASVLQHTLAIDPPRPRITPPHAAAAHPVGWASIAALRETTEELRCAKRAPPPRQPQR